MINCERLYRRSPKDNTSFVVFWDIETMCSSISPYATPYAISAICVSTSSLECMVVNDKFRDPPEGNGSEEDFYGRQEAILREFDKISYNGEGKKL